MVAKVSLVEKLLLERIRLKSYAPGNHRTTCPQCSHTRRNKSETCLAIIIEAGAGHALWLCHHCGWKGRTQEQQHPFGPRRRRPAPKKPATAPGAPTAAILRWFAERGISEAVVRRNKIGYARHYIPKLDAQVDCIAFPYFRDGQLINIKYRALEAKAFAQEKDAEKIFYGLDDLAEAEDVLIVEGECDKLAFEEAGFRNVLSVPDGAVARLKDDPSEDDAKFEYLANCEEQLGRFKRFILAVDADAKGQILEEELARRLGKEHCWRVRWPDGQDVACKDANETLLMHGSEVVRECVAAAEAYPVTGLYRIADCADEALALYEEGRKRGVSTGWPSLDEYMTIRPGELSVVTGIPNSGKSEFVDALLVNIARRLGWRFALCSFENPPDEHIAKLAEKHVGAPFFDGLTRRMSKAELLAAMDWLGEHFVLIRAGEESPTIDWILERGRIAVLRHGVRGLVIDPYNEIEHMRPRGMTETEYISELLSKLRRFAENHGVHVWIVAHPAKMQRENGKLPVPTLYDISGSANWANKPDIGVVVHRDLDNGNTVEIYVRKVRFKSVGRVGVIELQWDRATGRYAEPAAAANTKRWSD
jgi:twinkle protein